MENIIYMVSDAEEFCQSLLVLDADHETDVIDLRGEVHSKVTVDEIFGN